MHKSVQKWVDDTSYELLGGRKLILRLSPRVGKTHLMKILSNELGDSAVFVDGSEFAGLSHAQQQERIETPLKSAIEKHHSAQLIFDSYDKAIEGSKGTRLQNWLSSRLIDGADAQDIGAIFTARCNTEIERASAGSPLMSRVTPIDPPLLKPMEEDDETFTAIRDWFGEAAILSERAHTSNSFNPTTLADRLEQDLSYIEDVRKSLSGVITRGYLDRELDSYPARCASYGLMTEKGTTKLFDRLHPLLTTKAADDPLWPEDWEKSIEKFSRLIADANEVIWSDRYMYRDTIALKAFLRKVTQKTRCKILLLGAENINGRSISRPEMLSLCTVPKVEARWITPSDYSALHDRHLATGTGGWVVPQVHVIIGLQTPGSTVVAQTSAFGVDYTAIWRRSIAPNP